MAVQLEKEYKIMSDFSEIIKWAYEKGISDGTVTVEQMIEDLKSELLKMKTE